MLPTSQRTLRGRRDCSNRAGSAPTKRVMFLEAPCETFISLPVKRLKVTVAYQGTRRYSLALSFGSCLQRQIQVTSGRHQGTRDPLCP